MVTVCPGNGSSDFRFAWCVWGKGLNLGDALGFCWEFQLWLVNERLLQEKKNGFKPYRGAQFWKFSGLSNSQRARSLRARPQKRVTLIMVGLFTIEATISRSSTLGERERERGLIRIWTIAHVCGATIADVKTAASWGEGKKNCKNSP